MTIEEVRRTILADLGVKDSQLLTDPNATPEGVGVEVELSTSHIDIAIQKALLWLSFYCPLKGQVDILTLPGAGKYNLSGLPPQAEVVRVARAGEEAPFRYDPLRIFSNGFDITDISEFAYIKNYIQVAREVYGLSFTWEWDPPFLYIHPKPSGSYPIRVEYIYPYQRVDDIPVKYLPFFLLYAGAQAKKMLARIRGKYSGVPAPEGSVELDADTLQQLAQEEEQTAIEGIRRLLPAGGVIVG